jgi:hypothetical protein
MNGKNQKHKPGAASSAPTKPEKNQIEGGSSKEGRI